MSTAFNFGHDATPPKTEYGWFDGCTGEVICATCGKRFGICREVEEQLNPKENRSTTDMDLAQYRSKKSGNGKFERLPWFDGHCLPAKGATITINDVREPRKKSNIVAFLDVTLGKKRFTWSIRKGFTLDALLDELGSKTERWTGKKIKVVKGGDDGQYVNVDR